MSENASVCEAAVAHCDYFSSGLQKPVTELWGIYTKYQELRLETNCSFEVLLIFIGFEQGNSPREFPNMIRPSTAV